MMAGGADRNLRTDQTPSFQMPMDVSKTTHIGNSTNAQIPSPAYEAAIGGWPEGNFQPDPNDDRNIPNTIPQAPTGAFVNATATEPPRFPPDRYDLYKKEMLWRRDIRHGVSDQQLIGIMALKADGVIKITLAQYMENTRSRPARRSLGNSIGVMDTEMAKTPHGDIDGRNWRMVLYWSTR